MTIDDVFDELAAALAGSGAVPGTMFGKRALMLQGKAFACLKGDRLALRLGSGSPAHNEALRLRDAELFDPSGKDRPFRDWVAVPATHADQWTDLAMIALSMRAS